MHCKRSIGKKDREEVQGRSTGKKYREEVQGRSIRD